MIQAECLCRVLYFIVGNSCGTCFSYEKGVNQVLITARHIFKELGYPNNEVLYFKLATGLISIKCDIYYHDNPEIDVAIINPKNTLTQVFQNSPSYSSEGIILSQDAYFLGFPNNINNLLGVPGSNPTPFVKKCCISGIRTEKGVNYIYLDGINNKGFSGGPVCFQKMDGTFSICSVINGYNTRQEPVFYIDKNGTKQPIKIKTEGEMNKNLLIDENQGIIITTDIKYALEIINKHF